MFETITDYRGGIPKGGPASLVTSWTLHIAATAVVVAIPFLSTASSVPDAPSIMAFVAPAAAAPPPPPPPPAPAVRIGPVKATTTTPSPNAAPIEAPSAVTPEPPSAAGADVGVEGGVEGGVPGGVVGGLVMDAPPPPPPPPAPEPPPAPAPKGPVRIGGAVRTPELVRRVEPEYPPMAQRAGVAGMVILEATVNEQGGVTDVRILRSIPLLNDAARAAVRQWQYKPLLLNGQAYPFIVTVMLTFSLSR